MKISFLEKTDKAWMNLNSFLNSLTNEQMTEMVDLQGWSVKDHLSHLAAWEESIIFLLQGKPRHEGLRIDMELYNNGSIDEMNKVIQKQHEKMSIDEVIVQLRDTHSEFVSLINTLSDDDLNQPLQHFHPEAKEGDHHQIIKVISDNTVDHFMEHLIWIRTLALSK